MVKKDPGASFIASGSVVRGVNATTGLPMWVMSFSQFRFHCEDSHHNRSGGQGCQSIFFASSEDLRRWRRVDFGENDTNVFKYNEGLTRPLYMLGASWDCISPLAKPDGSGYYGFITASPANGLPGVGVAETTDSTGYHWRALPPITGSFGNLPKGSPGELGGVAVLRGRYYMLFGGGLLWSSTSPTVGYEPVTTNHFFSNSP